MVASRLRSGTSNHRLGWLLGLALTLATGHASAAGPAALPTPGAADPAASGEAMKRAAEAFKGKRWEDALAAGRASWAAGGGADALETIGVAALQLGQAALAWQCYQAIVDDPAAPAKTQGRARNQLKALQGQTGVINVETSPQGAKISVAGVYMGTSPVPPLRAMPGKFEVAAEFPGGAKVAQKVDVGLGKEVPVKLEGPSPAPVAAAPVVVPVVVPVAVAPPPVPVAPPPPPPAPVTAAPKPVVAAPAPKPQPSAAAVDAELAKLPVPGNPVMAGMHRLALKLGSGMRADDPDGLRRVAVMPFEASTEKKEVEELGNLSAELLAGRMAAQPRIVQVERQRLQSVVGEIKRAEGGQVSPDGAVNVGKLLGANAVILGSVGDAGSDYLVTARAVDVETGRVLVASDESVPRAGMVALSEDMVEVKTPLGAALRSAAVPGWGQIYNGDTVRGVAYIVGFAGFAGTAIVSAELGREAKNEYQENKPSTVDRREDGNAHYERVNIALAGLGVVWLASVLDAYFTGEDARIVHVPDAPAGGASAGVFRF